MSSGNIRFKIKGIREVCDEFQLNDSQMSSLKAAILSEATNSVAEAWKSEARKGLHTTRDMYVRGIGVINSGRYTNVIVLNGSLANAMEMGRGAFNMKLGFKKSSKIEYSKNGGWYMSIPFRYAVPGSLGESSAFSGVLPSSIYELIRSFEKDSVNSSGDTKTSLSAIDIPSDYATKGRRAEITNVSTNTTFGEYIHKSSQYEGLQRDTKTYEGATQGQYNTFRRVSSNSDPNSWIHPGFTALNYAQNAINSANLDTVVNNTIDKFLSILNNR